MIAGKKYYGIYLTPDVNEQLNAVASANKRSRSQVVELLIGNEYKRLDKNSQARIKL